MCESVEDLGIHHEAQKESICVYMGTYTLGMAALRILLLTFISRFVIDFLSIRKVCFRNRLANNSRLTLDEVLARVVLEGDSDFALWEKVKDSLPTIDSLS